VSTGEIMGRAAEILAERRERRRLELKRFARDLVIVARMNLSEPLTLREHLIVYREIDAYKRELKGKS
jgi:hypothetical protein